MQCGIQRDCAYRRGNRCSASWRVTSSQHCTLLTHRSCTPAAAHRKRLAVHSAAAQTQTDTAVSWSQLKALAGVWDKDLETSDNSDAVVALVGLNGLKRMGIQLIRGLELSLDDSPTDGTFQMGVFSAVGSWFQVKEKYPLDGSWVANMRRDLRLGSSNGRVGMSPDGHLTLQLQWEEPYAGTATDVFRLVQADALPNPYVSGTGQGNSSSSSAGGGGQIETVSIQDVQQLSESSAGGGVRLEVQSTVTVGGRSVTYVSRHSKRQAQ